MMDRRRQTGQQGEDLATAYLTERGYELVERNWRCPAGELDIIMEKEATLVFVEVRARRSRRFGLAEESITPAKQARLIELAQTYLQQNDLFRRSWRIDVVAVGLSSEPAHINHIENAVGWD
jgi:putative endonuclease